MADVAADELDGLETTCKDIEDRIYRAVDEHEHLDSEALDVVTMYVVGSLGAGKGRKGSDLDIIVELQYNGKSTGHTDWLEYVQHDIESKLKRNRTVIAESLPQYIGYVDPKLCDRWDCEHMISEMSSHGDYDRVYDVYREHYINADKFF